MKQTEELEPIREPLKQPLKQRHGGALRRGGQPGNRGGTGRPPSAIRAKCRDAFESRIAVAIQIADDTSIEPRDRLKALELLARLGLGTIDCEPISDDEARGDAMRAAGASEFEVITAAFLG